MSQKQLFLYNRSLLDADTYAELLEIETPWAAKLLSEIEESTEPAASHREFKAHLDGILEEEATNPPPSALFLANEADREQFKVIVDQFAVDALTEAQAFFPILHRLPMRAQMPVMRVLIDEFGCGNLAQMHSNLYRKLLAELGSPTELDHFVGIAVEEVFEFVNIFHWMTKRAPHFEYFLGALCWFESVVPTFFKHYADACERLGVENGKYFTEHMHIDEFHAKDALLALREAEKDVHVDYTRAWIGAQLANSVTGRAFDATVELAQERVVQCA